MAAWGAKPRSPKPFHENEHLATFAPMEDLPGERTFRRFKLDEARSNREQFKAARTEAAHQSEALTKLHDWFNARNAGVRGGILSLPTGGGKTFTAVRFLCTAPLSDGYKVLWLANTHHLLEQAIDGFGPWERSDPSLPVEVGQIREPRSTLDVRIVSGTTGHWKVKDIEKTDDVVIATLQTVVHAWDEMHPRLRDWLETTRPIGVRGGLVVVFDEAHHAPAPSYAGFLQALRTAYPTLCLLGLTATPTYTDERRQGWLRKLFPQGILYSVARGRLIAAGILSKPHFMNAETHVTAEFDDQKYQRWLSSYGDLPGEVVTKLAENQQRNDLIVAAYIRDKKKYGKTIIFADRWIQCEYLRHALRQQDVRADAVYSHVDAGLPTVDARNRRSRDENAKVIEKFRRGELDVLINVRMLTEGTDVPTVETVFLTRQTTSNILLTQMVGRALRGPRFGGTADAHIVSFIDNWKQVISFADVDSLPEGLADDNQPEYGKRAPIQLISIELVRRLTRQMYTGRGIALAPFRTMLPLGWYRVEFVTTVDNTDQTTLARQLVLVFEHEKAHYEAFLAALTTSELEPFKKEDTTLDQTRAVLEIWQEKFFPEPDQHAGAELSADLFNLARHMAQSHMTRPTFFPFIERETHDVDGLAKQYEELNTAKLTQVLDIEYKRPDRFWSSLYQNLALFRQQVQAVQNRLVDAAQHGADPATYHPPVESPTLRPAVELSEATKRAVIDRDQRCLCCGEDARRRLQVDHILPTYLGTTTEMDKLQALCLVCNGHKGIAEVNFRTNTSTLAAAPSKFEALPLPSRDDASDAQTWERYVRRTVNFFYQCAAVDSVKIGRRGPLFYGWEVRLYPGLDAAWIHPHIAEILCTIRTKRAQVQVKGPDAIHVHPADVISKAG